jgi:hypothetical protein
MQDPPSASSASPVVNRSIALGLAIMIVSETATLARIEPFASWNTPIAWTGFIIFADAMVYRARGNSWMRSSPREFIALCLVSIPLWLVFEWFNLALRNWHYVGLPDNLVSRTFGYAWSFATIWPAIFEGAELVSVWRAGRAGGAGQERPERAMRAQITQPTHPAYPADPADLAHPADPGRPALALPALGALMLASPFLVTPAVARYLAAPVWLGFVLLLDPINALRGEESLWLDWRAGQFNRTKNLILSGFLCGVLWELWNYWAHTKWLYAVPIMETLKVFEMPLPGYLGFPAFALECFTMYVFVRSLIGRPGRPIAL